LLRFLEIDDSRLNISGSGEASKDISGIALAGEALPLTDEWGSKDAALGCCDGIVSNISESEW